MTENIELVYIAQTLCRSSADHLVLTVFQKKKFIPAQRKKLG
jgi:hypothetical protein